MVASRIGGLSTYHMYWGLIYLGGGLTVRKIGKGFRVWRGNGQSEELYFLLVEESGFIIVACMALIEAGSYVKLG